MRIRESFAYSEMAYPTKRLSSVTNRREMIRNWFIQPHCINAQSALRRTSPLSSLNPCNFAVAKLVKLSKRFNSSFKLILKNPVFRELQDESSARGHQFCGNPKEFPADSPGHLLVCCSPEGLLFKPVHQIVRQHHQFKVDLCAGPTPAHTLVQSETVDAFLDEILAAGPLVVKAPHRFSGIKAACGNDLIVVGDGLRLEQLELFSSFFSGLDCLADHHQTQFPMRVQWERRFANGHIRRDLPPRSDPQNKLLDVDELGHYDIEFYLAPDQPTNEVHVGKTAVGPQPTGHPIRDLAQHQSQKRSRLVGVRAVARTKNPSQVVSCLSDEAKQRVVTLPASLFRIVALAGPVLFSKNRDDMGIQIQSQGFELLETATRHIQQARVNVGNLKGRVDRDLVQEPADCALDRELIEFGDALKYLVPNKFHHVTRPEYPEHQRIQHAHTHLSRTVVGFAPITDAHHLQMLAQLAFFKEAANQTRAAKSCQILSGEFLLWSQILFFLLFLCYIRIHFLGASFSGVVGQTDIT